METTVFISRHSKKDMNYYNPNDNLLENDIKRPLSIIGEENAKKMSEQNELQDIDVVYSSNYIRSIETAKYVAKNNLEINVDNRLGERIAGLDKNFPKITHEFAIKQYRDENYKYGIGEYRREVTNRVREVLFEILNKHKGKNIFIVTHSTAMLFLFISFGKFEIDDKYKIIINGKDILENVRWNEHTPELFKLVFDENNILKDIKYIRW